MTILKWDKPAKVQTTEQWAKSYGFEDGPNGGYVPNMSEADKLSWKAKITGKKLGFPQVEIRKTTQRGSQVLIIVNLGDGYNYKYYKALPDPAQPWIGRTTKGLNVHMATNGPIQMTFDEMRDMQTAVDEAKLALESLAK